jgi:hypothetical protein
MAQRAWIGRCGLLGAVLVVGIGGVGPFDEWAWGQQQPPKELHVSLTVEGGFTSRDVGESGNVLGSHYSTSGTADSGRLLVTLAYSPIPEVTVYAVGGGATLQIDEFDGYSSSLDGMYGGGLTLSYNVLPMTAAFVDGRYLRYVTDDTVVMQCGPGVLCPSATGETITWNEYRLRFGLKSRMPITTYGGLQVSWVRAEDHINYFQDTGVPATLTLTEKDNVGVFGGISIPLDPLRRIRFFTEFNLFDEYAIRGGLTYSM